MNLFRYLIFTLWVGLNLCSPSQVVAQGGGPPMLTTDPGTPGKNHWEINTLFNYHFSNQLNIQIPATEIVYGIGNHFQISVQLPMPDIELNKFHFTTFSQPQIGVKFQALDEHKHYISLAVYPQVILPVSKDQQTQLFIPVELEKTFSNFCLGDEFGYYILDHPNIIFNSTVIGYQFKNEMEIMGEFYISKLLNQDHATTGLLNFGVRKPLNRHLMFMTSLGTQIITPQDENKEYLFGVIGVQILLGK